MSYQLPAQSTTFVDPNPTSGLHDQLAAKYAGASIKDLRTPALIIDRAVFARNCAEMHKRTQLWNWKFRAHIKTHKTVEGTRLQLKSSADETHAIVASTLQEAYMVANSRLVQDGTVNDILYGLPVGSTKLADLAALADQIKPHGAVLRIFVDSPQHVAALEAFNAAHPREPWSAFFKVDLGTTKRAGLVPGTQQFLDLLRAVVKSPAISLHGFYCHAGTSYASKSLFEASSYLTAEISAVLDAADVARSYASEDPSAAPLPPLTLSVGSTPTAHAFSSEAIKSLQARLDALGGAELELHAGNYPMLDLQQVATSLVPLSSVAQRVLAAVISTYPGRGEGGADEAMCDAGGIAMTRDLGPIPGHGDVVRVIRPVPSAGGVAASRGFGTGETGWRIGRMSQEHGILTLKSPADLTKAESLAVGDLVEIVGQHACVIAAAYPWYYVIDSDSDSGSGTGAEDLKVVDVWVPCKGW